MSIGHRVQAQDEDSLVLAYQRNFARSSLVTKLELLKEAASNSDASMGPLFDMALRFAIDNAALLGPDPQLKDLALVSCVETGKAAYGKASDDLWALFQAMKDQDVRAAALNALGAVGAGRPACRREPQLLPGFAEQSVSFGAQPEYPALEACIDALGAIGDGSSFPVLFSAYVTGYSAELTAKAAKALGSIKGTISATSCASSPRTRPSRSLPPFPRAWPMQFLRRQRTRRDRRGRHGRRPGCDDATATVARGTAGPVRELRFASAARSRALKWQRARPW